MAKEKTYTVKFELEVTAENKEEALRNAISDIQELSRNGSLVGDIKRVRHQHKQGTESGALVKSINESVEGIIDNHRTAKSNSEVVQQAPAPSDFSAVTPQMQPRQNTPVGQQAPAQWGFVQPDPTKHEAGILPQMQPTQNTPVGQQAPVASQAPAPSKFELRAISSINFLLLRSVSGRTKDDLINDELRVFLEDFDNAIDTLHPEYVRVIHDEIIEGDYFPHESIAKIEAAFIAWFNKQGVPYPKIVAFYKDLFAKRSYNKDLFAKRP